MAEFPHVFIAGEDIDRVSEDLARRLAEVGIRAPFVLSSVHGEHLAAHLDGRVALEQAPPEADQEWAAGLGSRAHDSGADALVAIGGGRGIDVAKLGAARAGLQLIAVPTQLSHDGICSPVAVVPDDRGIAASLGAIAPIAVYISIPTLRDAPTESVAAGIGDLLANPLALRDWRLAADRSLEELDQRAWDLSVESYELIKDDLVRPPAESVKDRDFLRRLADALVLSGMAMIVSGTSRPASGGEHEVSHAIDELFGGRGMHGAQVAFGCIISLALYGEDTASFRATLETLGLPQAPEELGLSTDDLVRVLVEAPNTRPGRFTILEDANLDEDELRTLVKKIWH
ncbi:MAG: iron-containing alcohol dehydrogenase [Actinomycetota bacterium]